VLIWLAVYLNFYLIAGSLGYWLEFGHVVVLSLLMVPLTLLPLQGVANLGSHEVGWVATLTLFGYSSDEALVLAAGSHVVLLAFVLILGAVGQVVGWLSQQPEEPAPGEPTSVYVSPNPLVRWATRRFLHCIMKSVSEVGSEQMRVLDAGCGEGFVVRALAQTCPDWHLVPLDVDRRRLQVVRCSTSHLDVVAASVYELPFAEDTFDVVLANELLEHLHDPARALAELRRVCKRRALLSVPLEPLFSLVNLCRGAHIRRLGRTPTHVNFWGRRGFLNLLHSSGWKVVRVRRCLIWTIVTAHPA
jgi:SAM-dependent methyltransferase